MECVEQGSYVDGVITGVHAGLLCWVWEITFPESPENRCDLMTVVGSAEVKLAVIVLTHDGEAYSHDSRFGMMSNISQLSEVK